MVWVWHEVSFTITDWSTPGSQQQSGTLKDRWGKMEASTTASSFSEEGSQQQKASFDGWRFSNYFEYVQRKENNLTVKCTLCPGRKLLSTACNSTSPLHCVLRFNNLPLLYTVLVRPVFFIYGYIFLRKLIFFLFVLVNRQSN